MARRLLLEDTVLKTPRAVEAFLAVYSHGKPVVRKLHLGICPPLDDEGFYLDRAGGVTANEMDLEVLQRLVRTTALAMGNVYHIQPADLARCSSLQALYLDVGSIVHTSTHAMQGVASSDLKHLSLSQALSIAYCDQLSEAKILDGATILRLDGPIDSANDLLAQLHTNLTSPRFRPKLTELHCAGWPLAAQEAFLGSVLISDWAKRAKVQVCLVTEEPRDHYEGDPSLWRFLDGAECRLKEAE
ncbi:hypothetical protein JCM8547_001324 [Rhodosporidiobolus lusitaniae]